MTAQKEKAPVGAEAQGTTLNPNNISNADFLRGLFPALQPDEYGWQCTFAPSPNSQQANWTGEPFTNFAAVKDYPHGNGYFSTALLKAPTGKPRKRRKDGFSRLAIVVVDDFTGDTDCTYRLQTSAGKCQVGWKLEKPITDVGIAERLFKALALMDLMPADKSGNNLVRYVRLPVQINTKYQPHFAGVLEHWEPEQIFTLKEVCEILGIDYLSIINTPSKATESRHNAPMIAADIRISDSELVANLCKGKTMHESLNIYIARQVSRGFNAQAIKATIHGFMAAHDDGTERYKARIAEIDRSLAGAVEKFAPEQPLARFDSLDKSVLRSAPTQDNCALIFAKHFRGKMVYAHRFGSWYEWDGIRWQRDDTRKAFNFCREIARDVNAEGKATYSTANFAAGVEAFCRAAPEFAITGEEFDRDNYLLNTPSGVVDLRTSVKRPAIPDDLVTKITAVAPTSEGGKVFLKFMEEVTGGDQELITFHQISLGACLSGAIEGHWMLFWTGTGRNGKNTLGDAVQYVLGDYAKKIPAATLMSKQHEAHPTEIAQLAGARLVTSSEVSDGDFWHESRINELTGDAMISARFMRQDFFQFRRTHKHLIYGNHRPQLRSVTQALQSRIKIVPFKQSFVGREDPTLPEKLKSEGSFILEWLIQGHKKWIDAGRKLPSCAAIESESKDYFESQSTVETWLKERTEKFDDAETPASHWPRASDLYADYSEWKKGRGESPVSHVRFSETLSKEYRKEKYGSIRYRGLRLKYPKMRLTND